MSSSESDDDLFFDTSDAFEAKAGGSDGDDDFGFHLDLNDLPPELADLQAAIDKMRAGEQGLNVDELVGAANDLTVGSTDFVESSDFTIPCNGAGDAIHSYSPAVGPSFKVRGGQYLTDSKKYQSKPCVTQLSTAEVFASKTPAWHVSSRPDSYVARALAAGDTRFKFVMNFLVPGAPHCKHLVAVFSLPTSLAGGSFPGQEEGKSSADGEGAEIPYPEDHPVRVLWNDFLNGGAEYRKDRLKIFPQLVEGAWVVQQTVGTRPAILGTKIDLNYNRGERYLEVGVDVGSSSVATVIANVVEGYTKALVLDLGFAFEGKTPAELPEHMFGALRVSRLNLDSLPLLE